jgi:choline-sulfatase
VGLAAFAQSAALLALTLAVGAAAALAARGVAARLPESASVLRAVVAPGVAGLLAALAVAGHGAYHGDIHGHGGGRALLMGAYGVLKKPELDLAPVAMLAAIGALTLALGASLRRVWFVGAAAGALRDGGALVGGVAGVRGRGGGGGDRRAARPPPHGAPGAAQAGRPRPRRLRGHLRRRRLRRPRPAAQPRRADAPGNGVDEDCSGADARRVVVEAPPPRADVPRPTLQAPRDLNLLLITVDTMRADLRHAGYAHPISPSLDALAAESVVFDRAYAISSYTGRAIGPMMTGRYPTECPRDGEHFTRYTAPNVFLAERLKAAGFRTFGAASHFYFEPRFGLAQGVDEWDLSAKPEGDGQETASADAAVADRVIAQLRRPENAAGRFFAWAHFFDPHKQYVEHRDLPVFARGERGRYDREVMNSDRQIGRVLAALRALPGGVAERTMVVVTSDHGEAFGEHGMGYHGVELWEELVRVPWIIHVPSLEARHIATPRGHIDLLPTVLELLSMRVPATDAEDFVSGQSLVAEMFGAPATARPVYCDLPEGPFNGTRRAMIDWPYKLLVRNARRPELFDLSTDPLERSDLSQSQPEALSRVRARYEQVRAGLRDVRQIETQGGGS